MGAFEAGCAPGSSQYSVSGDAHGAHVPSGMAAEGAGPFGVSARSGPCGAPSAERASAMHAKLTADSSCADQANAAVASCMAGAGSGADESHCTCGGVVSCRRAQYVITVACLYACDMAGANCSHCKTVLTRFAGASFPQLWRATSIALARVELCQSACCTMGDWQSLAVEICHAGLC